MTWQQTWRIGEMPTDECAACGHYLVEHEHSTYHCEVDVLGLNGQWRRCTCTFARTTPAGVNA